MNKQAKCDYQQRAKRHADQKRKPPSDGCEITAGQHGDQDTGHTGDVPDARHKQDRGDADERAPYERAEWRKFRR
jgi:hypothetical protein